MVQYFLKKPGTITYYSKGKVRDTDELNILSSENYEVNTFTKRLQGATDEHLGMNMYAENRVSICSRPKPADDSKEEDIAKPVVKKTIAKIEDSKEDLIQSDKEQTLFRSLLRQDDESKDTFKLNLFPEVKAGAKSGATASSDVINIDVGDSNIKKKKEMLKDFDDLDINDNAGGDGDDFLDLMDS